MSAAESAEMLALLEEASSVLADKSLSKLSSLLQGGLAQSILRLAGKPLNRDGLDAFLRILWDISTLKTKNNAEKLWGKTGTHLTTLFRALLVSLQSKQCLRDPDILAIFRELPLICLNLLSLIRSSSTYSKTFLRSFLPLTGADIDLQRLVEIVLQVKDAPLQQSAMDTLHKIGRLARKHDPKREQLLIQTFLSAGFPADLEGELSSFMTTKDTETFLRLGFEIQSQVNKRFLLVAQFTCKQVSVVVGDLVQGVWHQENTNSTHPLSFNVNETSFSVLLQPESVLISLSFSTTKLVHVQGYDSTLCLRFTLDEDLWSQLEEAFPDILKKSAESSSKTRKKSSKRKSKEEDKAQTRLIQFELQPLSEVFNQLLSFFESLRDQPLTVLYEEEHRSALFNSRNPSKSHGVHAKYSATAQAIHLSSSSASGEVPVLVPTPPLPASPPSVSVEARPLPSRSPPSPARTRGGVARVRVPETQLEVDMVAVEDKALASLTYGPSKRSPGQEQLEDMSLPGLEDFAKKYAPHVYELYFTRSDRSMWFPKGNRPRWRRGELIEELTRSSPEIASLQSELSTGQPQEGGKEVRGDKQVKQTPTPNKVKTKPKPRSSKTKGKPKDKEKAEEKDKEREIDKETTVEASSPVPATPTARRKGNGKKQRETLQHSIEENVTMGLEISNALKDLQGTFQSSHSKLEMILSHGTVDRLEALQASLSNRFEAQLSRLETSCTAVEQTRAQLESSLRKANEFVQPVRQVLIEQSKSNRPIDKFDELLKRLEGTVVEIGDAFNLVQAGQASEEQDLKAKEDALVQDKVNLENDLARIRQEQQELSEELSRLVVSRNCAWQQATSKLHAAEGLFSKVIGTVTANVDTAREACSAQRASGVQDLKVLRTELETHLVPVTHRKKKQEKDLTKLQSLLAASFTSTSP